VAAVVNNMMDNKLNVMKPIKEVVILPVYSMELNATEIQVAANGIIKK
jgi:multisubunit Na+/H+ antiporter MnhE subunit